MNDQETGPSASVIIPCRNSTRTLGLQLEALAGQVEAPPFEVVIADNGSTDHLNDLLEAWHDELTLRVVDAAGKPGAAYARNVGMSAAVAEKLLFCDSDDVVARDWVARACDALDVVEVFSGPAHSVRDDELGTDLDGVWRNLDAALPPGSGVHAGRFATWPIILGGNSGMRRETARAVRGYDASLPGDIEDNDLAFRLQDAGFAIAAAPGVRIAYRARTGSRQAFQSARSRGVAHIALCMRHRAMDRSPVLRGNRWVWEPLRVIGSGVRMILHPTTCDLEGLAGRAGLAVGIWEGKLRRLLSPGLAPSAIGSGFGAVTRHELIRRPMLILSPHLDDALFSAAELIRRGRPEVWTVFAGAPAEPITTSWDRTCGFADAHEAIRVRRAEDSAAFLGSSASVRYFDCLDGAYTTPDRRRRDLAVILADVSAWVDAHADSSPVLVIPAGAGVPVAAGVVKTNSGSPKIADRASGSPLAPAIALARRAKHQLYLRRRRRALAHGLAVNDDHAALRDAIGDTFAADSRVTLVLMEELPYSWWHSADDAVARASARWAREAALVRFEIDRAWKYARIAHYSSQLEVMDAAKRRLSQPGTLPAAERLWVLSPR